MSITVPKADFGLNKMIVKQLSNQSFHHKRIYFRDLTHTQTHAHTTRLQHLHETLTLCNESCVKKIDTGSLTTSSLTVPGRPWLPNTY